MALYRCGGGNKNVTKINLGRRAMGIKSDGWHTLTWDVSGYKDYQKFTINNFCDTVPDTIDLTYLGNGGSMTGTSMGSLSKSYNPVNGLYTVSYNLSTDADWNSEIYVHAELFIYS